MIIAVLAFIVTISVLIVFHEYGHYRVAVACGVKVLRFSVGFGHVVWRYQRTPDDTEFVISALPFGGYVRMLDEREGAVNATDLHQAFNRKPLWQRTAVVSAGPVANLLLAVLLYCAAHWIGVEEPTARLSSPAQGSLAEGAGIRAGDWVHAFSTDAVQWQDVRSMVDLRWHLTQAVMREQRVYLMVSAGQGHGQRVAALPLDSLAAKEIDSQLMRRIGLGTPFSDPVLGDVKVGGPAAQAGLRAGDRVMSVDGVAILDAHGLIETIRASVKPARPDESEPAGIVWVVQRDGQEISFRVQPAVVVEGTQQIGRVEAYIRQSAEMVKVRYGPWDGFAQAFERTWDAASLTLRMLGRMLIGDASLKNLSGPITIADYAGQSVRLGLAYYLVFLAVVSTSLGVLNLLPLPMLDGGHLMYYLFEAMTGRPLSDVWLERLQRGGVAFLLLMTSLALYNDLARLLGQP